MADPKTLKETIACIPKHLRPSNVGDISSVAWPMWYQVDFNLGTNPTFTSNTRQTQSFQNTQEAAFLFLAITRKHYGYDSASALAPLQVEIRDRQSSRQFNDRPIPLQMFGRNSHPTTLPTPMLIQPNAFLDFNLSSFMPEGESMATVGTGKIQLSMFGYRIRVQDADKVLSSIFG